MFPFERRSVIETETKRSKLETRASEYANFGSIAPTYNKKRLSGRIVRKYPLSADQKTVGTESTPKTFTRKEAWGFIFSFVALSVGISVVLPIFRRQTAFSSTVPLKLRKSTAVDDRALLSIERINHEEKGGLALWQSKL